MKLIFQISFVTFLCPQIKGDLSFMVGLDSRDHSTFHSMSKGFRDALEIVILSSGKR